MSRRGLLYRRLLERRLLGDGDGAVSLIPGAFATLGVSSFAVTLLMQERSLFDLTLLLSAACFVWAALKSFLDARDAVESALDRAVLEPLPIPPREIAEARALVEAVFLLVGTANLALPAVVMTAAVYDPRSALAVASAALVATLAGMALGQGLRAGLIGALGLGRLEEWEGPLRLMVSIGLFAVLFSAPDPGVPLASHPWLAYLPPFSSAVLLRGEFLGAVLTAAGALLLLRVSARGAQVEDGAAARAKSDGSLLLARLSRSIVSARERKGFDFALANISRDRSFRSRVYPLFAFPFAVVVLVASNPDQPRLVMLALFGVPVYLGLAQTFQEFSESERGPQLLRSLPMLDVAGFRLGAEKAFLVGLLAPIFLALLVALLLATLLAAPASTGTLLIHAVHALLYSILWTAYAFENHEGLPFSQTDRGVYPADLGGGAFLGLFASAGMAVVSAWAVQTWLGSIATAGVLAIAIPPLFAWKRRRRERLEPSHAGAVR